MGLKNLSPKIFGPKKSVCAKKSWVKKNWVRRIYWVQNIFSPKTNFIRKIWAKNIKVWRMYFGHIIFGPKKIRSSPEPIHLSPQKTFTTTTLSPKPLLNKSTPYHNHHHHNHHSLQPPLPIYTLYNNHLHDNHPFKSTICTTKTNLTHLFLFYHIPWSPTNPCLTPPHTAHHMPAIHLVSTIVFITSVWGISSSDYLGGSG